MYNENRKKEISSYLWQARWAGGGWEAPLCGLGISPHSWPRSWGWTWSPGHPHSSLAPHPPYRWSSDLHRDTWKRPWSSDLQESLDQNQTLTSGFWIVNFSSEINHMVQNKNEINRQPLIYLFLVHIASSCTITDIFKETLTFAYSPKPRRTWTNLQKLPRPGLTHTLPFFFLF